MDRGRFTIEMDSAGPGEDDPATIGFAVKARELGRKGIVVGDRVDVAGEGTATVDDPARIVRRHDRTSTLRRTADDTDPVERVLVANATQLAIVTATTDPDPSPGLIDRTLVAALDAGIAPALIITKSDLRPVDDLLALYAPLDLPTYIVTRAQIADDLLAWLRGERTVIIGHSGVGKSTLVNALVPEADRSTGRVNAVTGRGRHTSTSVVAFHLPGGGLVIDTPGVRSFGLAHVDVGRLVHAFGDLEELTEACPRACSHDEPDCVLSAALATASPRLAARIGSLRRLIRSRTASPAGG